MIYISSRACDYSAKRGIEIVYQIVMADGLSREKQEQERKYEEVLDVVALYTLCDSTQTV
jgi:hypothetical protein